MEEGTWGWAAIHRLFQTPFPPQSRSEPEEQPNRSAMPRRGLQRRNPTASPYLSSPLNPTSSRRNPAPEPAAAPPAAAAVRPSITLEEWWLVKAKGHNDKISVAGHYMKDHEIHEYTASRIVDWHGPSELENIDGTIVFNLGFFSKERTLVNGFTLEACDTFWFGFPSWYDDWQSYNPNLMSSETVSQPRSPPNSGSSDDCNVSLASTVEATNDNGRDNDSHENNGCQNTTMTVPQPLHDKIIPGEAANVNPLEKGNPHLTRRQAKLLQLSLPESQNLQLSIPESSASKGLCSNDKVYVGKDNSSHTNNGHQKTHVTSPKRQGRPKKRRHETHVASPKRRGHPKKHKHASEDASNLSSSDVQSSMKGKEPAGTSRKTKQASAVTIWRPSVYGNPHVTRQQSKLLSMSIPESLNLQRTRSGRIVVPKLDLASQDIIYNQDRSIYAIKEGDNPLLPLRALPPSRSWSASKKEKRRK